MNKIASVAFIGSVGIPNNYGGFESFLESIAPTLTNKIDMVTVTCDASRYEDHNPNWNNVNRIFIPISANGIYSIIHDFIAFLFVLKKHKHIIFLGVSAGIFFPLIRILSCLFGSKIYVNIDGVEWRRQKFSGFTRLFLKLSDLLAQFFSDVVIIDNEGLSGYIIDQKKTTSACIGYSGDHVHYSPKVYIYTPFALTICRIEPENNCELLLEAYSKLNIGTYFFIGNWESSDYGRRLKERFSSKSGILCLDPIYEPRILSSLRANCQCYLHGHSVGGTNPSLVEMLFYDAPIIAFDCIFNRFTAGDEISYFSSEDTLIEKLNIYLNSNIVTSKNISKLKYTKDGICDSYIKLFNCK